VTRLNYTANSRLSALTDAELKTLRYQHDENGNNTARVSPDLSSESYTYNDTGELTGKNNRRGKPILVERDANGRVTRIDYDDNTFVAYTYDSVGKLLSVEDVTGVTTMDYYANHLLRYIIYPDTRFLEYTYDSAGRRSSLTDQTGYQQNYSYNFDGQLEIISDGTGNILAQYSYDLSGRLTERTLGNGVNSTYQYDKSNRVTAIVTKGADGEVISDYAYAFDVNNRRTKVTSRDGVWDYSYDATGQLVAAAFTSDNPEVPSKTIEYVYDKVGNRIQEIVNGSSTAYDINNMNQYSQAGVFSYSYDLDGNLIEKSNGIDRWTYEYNDNNRLIRSVTPEGEKEYIYNGLGYLVSVIADGVAKNYMVDPMGFGNVVGEYDESGTLLSRYTHGLGLISKDENFYTFDGNGNTSEMTNAANEIINFYGYEPFGNNLFEGESVENDFEFVGQLGVREMGEDLIYMRNRFYSPALGRFMAEDPIGLAGGDVSFYRYVLNDPVNFVDPWGLLTTAQNFAIGAAGTTASMASMSSVALAPAAPFIGGGTAVALTLVAGGTPSEASWNGLTAALGGPLFGFALKGGVGAEGLIMAAGGDYMLDLLWADQPPPWESSDDNPCP
jgi:RHS repeat-associated protein